MCKNVGKYGALQKGKGLVELKGVIEWHENAEKPKRGQSRRVKL